jgi:YVTN family beta-propeller protein
VKSPALLRAAAAASALWLSAGCSSHGPLATAAATAGTAAHSSSMAISPDGKLLAVVNPEADTVSFLDLGARALAREVLLASAPPAADATTGAFAPAVMPRSVAFSPDGKTLYVSGERSSAVHVVDVAAGAVRQSIHVGSEPVGLVVAPGGASVLVACSQDGKVVEIDTSKAAVAREVAVGGEPWALAWSGGGQLLVTHFMGPGLTAIDAQSMTVQADWTVPDTAPRGDKRLAHGAGRGLYDAAARPGGSGETWTIHALLATDTAQPDLDFESTAFPALSILDPGGAFLETLSTDAKDIAGIDGSIADVVSGPHALAFTGDGAYALMVDANSEDVLLLDARQRTEIGLVRPLPGAMPDGIVLSADEQFAYVDERLSGDVAVLKLDRSSGKLTAVVDGAPIPRVAADPVPATLRLGQRLFNSANSTEYPITTDHWVACATCHMEGRSDAVTWRFEQGPRDTPTNAGGMTGTGFLFRTADRTKVQDYWHTINVEQGGRFDPAAQSDLLDALTAYVNQAIPLPVPPTTDPSLVAKGAQVFKSSGCDTCHAGPRFTDSGQGNPTLDLTGPILLHDVGTCVTSGPFPDVAHEDVDGDPRAACDFDTPSLSGVASTPPYLHDGSAPTLADAVARMPGAPSDAADVQALVEYLRSL